MVRNLLLNVRNIEAENIFESKKDWTDYVRNGRLVNDARQITLEIHV